MKVSTRVFDTVLGWFGFLPAKPDYFLDFVGSGQVDVVASLLAIDRTLVEERDAFGSPALHLAVQGGNLELTECLIEHGANLDAVDADGATALHHAADIGEKAIIRLMLTKGAATTIQDVNGDRPIDWAADSEIAEWIK